MDPEVLMTGSRLTATQLQTRVSLHGRRRITQRVESRAQGVKSKAMENHSQAEVGLSPNQGSEFHGQRSLYSPRGRRNLDMTEAT